MTSSSSSSFTDYLYSLNDSICDCLKVMAITSQHAETWNHDFEFGEGSKSTPTVGHKLELLPSNKKPKSADMFIGNEIHVLRLSQGMDEAGDLFK